MAGHSHWAGIKHKKGRADKQRSKIFSKLSKEITVAAKLGSKDSGMNPRLRSAMQAARAANMPKDNIERAINKSETNKNLNYNSFVYEGFGPEKIAIIIETLTDNKNRTASNIRTIFQKFGGNLGETGVASHQFKQVGIIRIDKKKISEEEMLELAINSGAEDCSSEGSFHQIITKKDNFYKGHNKGVLLTPNHPIGIIYDIPHNVQYEEQQQAYRPKQNDEELVSLFNREYRRYIFTEVPAFDFW